MNLSSIYDSLGRQDGSKYIFVPRSLRVRLQARTRTRPPTPPARPPAPRMPAAGGQRDALRADQPPMVAAVAVAVAVATGEAVVEEAGTAAAPWRRRRRRRRWK